MKQQIAEAKADVELAVTRLVARGELVASNNGDGQTTYERARKTGTENFRAD